MEFSQMHQHLLKPSIPAYLRTLKACANVGAVWQGRWVHDQLVRKVLERNPLLGSSLVDMYCKNGALSDARRVFDSLPKQYAVSWGAMITGYADSGHGFLALDLFENMQHLNLTPSRATFLAVLKACTCSCAYKEGALIHHQIVNDGLELDQVMGSCLVDMYAKGGSLKEASEVFNTIPRKDVVTWGAMIGGFAEHDKGNHSLELFERMQECGVEPNKPIFLSSLKACGSAQALSGGRILHSMIVKSILDIDVLIGSSLVDMYAKCGSLHEAQKVFDSLPKQTVVTWGAIIIGYAEQGHGDLALELFEKMKAANLTPDKVTFTCALKACIGLEAMEQGRVIHEDIKKVGLQKDVVVGTALIDMYNKCGSVEEARSVFDEMPTRNTLTWGAMLSGYAQQGHGSLALELFEAMQKEGIKPNKVTFLCALKACSCVGALLHGRWLHAEIVRHSLDADISVRNAVMDMYARCGSLQESHRLFSLLKDPDVVSWASLLTGYAKHGVYDVAEQRIEAMGHQGLKPNIAVISSLLSACSHAGVVAEGCQFFNNLTKDHGLLPSFEHYSCMIDLFGRGGRFSEAEDLSKTMPSLPNLIAQMSLLTHIRTFTNLDFEIKPSNFSNHLALPKAYGDTF
ncbi:hypothetical protein GOP47_0010897 [Adiantum capillus-veneris]|uniref:Pentatricopeptide repeat-containing protein n=1 Tax=Adiantum capillus-veneris TaxID=13818 RepID=A0A9D4ZJ58_ADICA|nr:hypothetical protein GOP47_0010897 [Adiantum capillus-veneris]